NAAGRAIVQDDGGIVALSGRGSAVTADENLRRRPECHTLRPVAGRQRDEVGRHDGDGVPLVWPWNATVPGEILGYCDLRIDDDDSAGLGIVSRSGRPGGFRQRLIEQAGARV